MGTIIDSLTVELGLDSSQFSKGREAVEVDLKKTKDASISTGKEMEAAGARAADFFAKIKVEALGLIGVLAGTGAMGVFIKDATTSLAALGREAHNIGIATPELAAFRNAIERNGGSAEAATQSFRNLTDAAENFRVFGQGSQFAGFLNPIGAAIGDSPMAIFMKFVKFAGEHKNDAPLINLIGKGLGFDQGVINEAMKGTVQVLADLKKSYELGVPTDDMVKHMQDLQAATIGLGQAAEFSGERLLNKMAPGLEAVADRLTLLITKYPDLANAITAAVLAIGGIQVTRKILALLGLGAFTDAILAEELIYRGTRIGGLNEGEDAVIRQQREEENKRRAAQGLPPIHYEGTPAAPGQPTGPVPGSTISPPAPGTAAFDVMQQTRDFWLSKGFTDAQVAGILAAGPAAESNFNPNLPGDDGTSYGLYQEHLDRKDALFAKYGPHPTVEQQNQFAYDEAQARGIIPALHLQQTAGGTARIWTRGFEAPAHAREKAEERAAAAPKFQAFPPPSPALPLPPPPPPSPASSLPPPANPTVGASPAVPSGLPVPPPASPATSPPASAPAPASVTVSVSVPPLVQPAPSPRVNPASSGIAPSPALPLPPPPIPPAPSALPVPPIPPVPRPRIDPAFIDALRPGPPSGTAAVAAAAAAATAAARANTTSVVLNGDIHIQTQATDAAGMARDVKKAITDSWMAQANRGLA